MKNRSIVLLIVFALFFSLIVPAFAEGPTTEAQARYAAEKKDPNVAIALCAVPPLCIPPISWLDIGHAYAGNWVRSLIFDLFDLGGSAIVVWGGMDQAVRESIGLDPDPTDHTLQTVGCGILIVSMIARAIDAGNTANDTNKDMRKKYGLEVGIRNNLPVMEYSYNF